MAGVPWHFIFESLAYLVAFRVYTRSRDAGGDFLSDSNRLTVIVAALVGAAAGSRLLYVLEDFHRTRAHLFDPLYWISGKTILGALLGGTMAVEWVKRREGIRRRTGDLFALPIAIGIAIGRIGCLLSGLSDDTFGTPTTMPWGIDLGDGINRHPVQIYEIAAMLALAYLLSRARSPAFVEGDRFRLFLFSYCVWRLLVDSFKPEPKYAGLSTLQWTSLAAAAWYTRDIWRIYLRTRQRAGVANV